MKIAIFPGSFNPFHEGHDEILSKALEVFDKVIVARGVNPEKDKTKLQALSFPLDERVQYTEFEGLLADYVDLIKPCAVIRGLRNAQDLELEQVQQYWNEDLGMKVPIFYVICSRMNRHISSSAIRLLRKVQP